MPQSKLQLVWDINSFSTCLNGINIVIAPDRVAPFDIDVVVEEQDTALILSKPGVISTRDDKPAWFLANKLESQLLLQPGSVVPRLGNPHRLLAIVHDLDSEPSWDVSWITEALDNIFMLSNKTPFSSMKLPVLGAVHGRFQLDAFLKLFIHAVNHYQGALRKVWLVVPRDDCPKALSLLKEKQQ